MAAYYGNPDFNEGIILASESYDDKGKLTLKSETQEINENFPHTISVKGYTLRQMNMGQGKIKSYNFFNFANLSNSFLLPSFSNSTVAVVFGGFSLYGYYNTVPKPLMLSLVTFFK